MAKVQAKVNAQAMRGRRAGTGSWGAFRQSNPRSKYFTLHIWVASFGCGEGSVEVVEVVEFVEVWECGSCGCEVWLLTEGVLQEAV